MKATTSLKKKYKIIKIPIYEKWMEINFDPHGRCNWLGDEFIDSAGAFVVVDTSEHVLPVDLVMSFHFDQYCASHLVHECVHATNFIFDTTGMQLDVHNDEAQAYLAGWFGEQVDDFYRQLKERL